MKRNIKYITIPLHIWTHPDLNVYERVVLIEIDSYSDNSGCSSVGVQTISSATGLSAKVVKECMKSLRDKGAIQPGMTEDGQKVVRPLLYKERYVTSDETVTIGDNPKDIEQIDWDDISVKWNEINPDMPPISRWTPLRKRKLKSVLKQTDITIEDLYKAFRIINATDFLKGRNDRQWMATFNWLIGSSNNILKVLEGTYSKSYIEKNAYTSIMSGNNALTNKLDDELYR